ncbi:MAG TPA: NAD(P)-dependent oxidoreductase [Verrucomicrobiae bacterium]|jgi:3-hydroxyisobutyrate dehydrogenase|nr:NAD(P)-dependent oxidoreductase [Verrucomicrobiae bacterium]
MLEPPRIGLVGTGRMGANIARHLHDVGFPVAALYDARPQIAVEIAAEIGAEATQSLARVTAASDVIITVVSDDRAMRQIFEQTGDSLLIGAAGKSFINCATVAPSTHVDAAERAASAGAQTLEACMASSIPQARNGTLYLMIGGPRETFDRLHPLLEAMSASLRYIGPSGGAAQVKALVNMVMNVNTAALAEGLGLGSALGVDLDMLREVFSQTGAASRVLETDGADMQHREHETYFSAEHAAKDSGIALGLAREVGLTLPAAQAAYDQYERMKTLGLGHLDKSGVAELTFSNRAKLS